MKLIKDTRVTIEETVNGRVFRDAFYYEQGKEPEDKDIETAAQKRIDDWVYLIEHSPVIPEPTKEELEKEKLELEARLALLDEKIAEKE